MISETSFERRLEDSEMAQAHTISPKSTTLVSSSQPIASIAAEAADAISMPAPTGFTNADFDELAQNVGFSPPSIIYLNRDGVKIWLGGINMLAQRRFTSKMH